MSVTTWSPAARFHQVEESMEATKQVNVPIGLRFKTRVDLCTPLNRTSSGLLSHQKQLFKIDSRAWSSAGRLHQVEYAMEVVKQASAEIGLRSKIHVGNHIGIGMAGLTAEGRALSRNMRLDCINHRLPLHCSSSNVENGEGNGRVQNPVRLAATKIGARERRLEKVQDEKRRKEGLEQNHYPEWATVLENACKDDVELREIIGDSLGNPEEMRKRVEERVRKKGRDVLSPLTGSSVPMTVTFRADFDATDANVWLELYGAPSDKDLETIGSVLRSWYLLGRLGSFNSMNMQLTQLPIDAKLTYSTENAAEALPSLFHNISDLEFQDNWGRFWIDFGTSDPVAMDVLINALSAVSSEHVGIKQLVFGGQKLGDWDEGMVDPEDGYRCYKI